MCICKVWVEAARASRWQTAASNIADAQWRLMVLMTHWRRWVTHCKLCSRVRELGARCWARQVGRLLSTAWWTWKSSVFHRRLKEAPLQYAYTSVVFWGPQCCIGMLEWVWTRPKSRKSNMIVRGCCILLMLTRTSYRAILFRDSESGHLSDAQGLECTSIRQTEQENLIGIQGIANPGHANHPADSGDAAYNAAVEDCKQQLQRMRSAVHQKCVAASTPLRSTSSPHRVGTLHQPALGAQYRSEHATTIARLDFVDRTSGSLVTHTKVQPRDQHQFL